MIDHRAFGFHPLRGVDLDDIKTGLQPGGVIGKIQLGSGANFSLLPVNSSTRKIPSGELHISPPLIRPIYEPLNEKKPSTLSTISYTVYLFIGLLPEKFTTKNPPHTVL